MMTLGCTILLGSNYVGGYMCAQWLWGRGTIDSGYAFQINKSVFAPLDWYACSELPGAETFDAISFSLGALWPYDPPPAAEGN